uniref:Uncharacterized protein n=1 Tax=Schistocephalus solidus TaxID=70667 RepID=A0A0X3PA99_SCHSO
MKIVNFRRTEALDAVFIQELIDTDDTFLTRKVNLINLLERSLLAITATNAEDEVIGCLVLNDSPPSEILNKQRGNEWFRLRFKFSNLNTCNTLFINLFVVHRLYRKFGYEKFIKVAFSTAIDIHHLLFLVPSSVELDEIDESDPIRDIRLIFSKFKDKTLGPIEFTHRSSNSNEVPSQFHWDVVHFKRDAFFPVLYARPALVNDNDDVQPIFESKTKILSSTYGEFYAAELVEAQNDKLKTIVVEVDGRAVGYMSATTEFDIDFVNEQYDLAPFNCLRKSKELSSEAPIEGNNQKKSEAKPDETLNTDIKALPTDDVRTETIADNKLAENGAPEEHEGAAPEEPEGAAPERGLNWDKLMLEKDRNEVRITDKTSTRSRTPRKKALLHSLSDASEDLRSSLMTSSQSLEHHIRVMHTTDGNWVRRYISRALLDDSNDIEDGSDEVDGVPNAFIIQLFGIKDEVDTRSIDFMPLIFDSLPNLDYAVISVPRLVPEFQLLQHFTRARPKRQSTVTQELYVFHRACLVSDFQVRPANRKDEAAILKLTADMHPFDRKLFLADLKNYMTLGREPDGNELLCYVATCLKTILGVAIARREESIEWIKAGYNLEDYVYFVHHGRPEFVTLIHFLMASSLHMRQRLFLKEIMRQAEKTCIFYFIYPPFTVDSDVKLNTLVTCLPELYAIRPRSRIAYPRALLNSEKAPQMRVLHSKLGMPAPAVYHITRNLIMESKLTINARIIVVGASTTSLAFLETLVFSTHMRFNNLVLLSPRGLPGDSEEPEDTLVNHIFPPDYMQERHRLGQVSLRTYVRLIIGKLTGLDRSRKVITVNGQSEVSYDYLILAPGLQFQAPCPVGLNLWNLKVKLGEGIKTTTHAIEASQMHPSNLFTLNDMILTKHAVRYVQHKLLRQKDNSRELELRPSMNEKLIEDPNFLEREEYQAHEGPIVVYGNCLEAYFCVQGLLKLGVPGIRIVMVQPLDLSNEPSVFEDQTVENAIEEAMLRAKVHLKKGYVVAQWNDEPDAVTVKKIKSVSFVSPHDSIRIRCVAFFSFHKRGVDYEFFKAVNDACLVFDGRLVIDVNFHTNDPCIRAAGPVTKLQRIYYNDNYTHALCNSFEVGERLAKSLLQLFDPSTKAPERPVKDEHHLLPTFKMPRIKHGHLPGDYRYLKVWAPGQRKDLRERMSQANFGRALVTGVPETGPGYFHLHINEYNEVSRICCLSKNEFPRSNLIRLFSVHEKALNNLVSRYDEGLITDFYAYFEEPWAMAIFHDRFDDFRQEIHELGCTKKDEECEPLISKIRARIESHREVSRPSVQSRYLDQFYLP